jgi:MoxR-like ATPase
MTPSTPDYSFSKEANYNLPRKERIDHRGYCYESYIASDRLVDAVNLAIELQRPLLLEGEPGCGKTRLASAIVYQLTQNNLRNGDTNNADWWPFYIWTVKSYTRARDGLYTFDAVGRLRDAQMVGTNLNNALTKEQIAELQQKLLDPKEYRQFGALGNALQETEKRAVVLIDEVDKADSDFANDLLLELDEFRFEVPETKEEINPPTEPPIVILTSNREKPLPDAFLRRCLYFNIEFPNGEALKEIAQRRLNINLKQEVEKALVDRVIQKFEEVRTVMGQPGSRPPGTSEFLEFLTALKRRSGEAAISSLDDLPNQLPLLGLLLKTKTDQELYVKKAQVLKGKTEIS